MKPEDFERQLGPFVLIQRPPDEATQQRALKLGAQRTVAVKPQAADTLSLLFEFDDLMIATLPFLEPNQALTVGRLPDCDLVIDDPSVSKHHAALTWSGELASVSDLKSSNGSTVNGVPVTEARAVKDGDEVSFGDARFCFLLTRTLHQRLTAGRFRAE